MKLQKTENTHILNIKYNKHKKITTNKIHNNKKNSHTKNKHNQHKQKY